VRRMLALVALGAAPAALAGGAGGDKWEGTWRVDAGAFASTFVLRPASDAGTRAQAPPCPGAQRAFYTGGYSGRRNGTVAACASGYSLRGRLYEGGKRVGDVAILWELAVTPDGSVGSPTFRGTYTAAGTRGRWSARWLRHGGTLPTAPTGGGAASPAARVEAMLRRNKAACRMTWSKLTARRSGKLWVVSANVSTFGHPGRARWEVVGTKIVPADQLAFEIMNGCR
jgi:hypothetical protein